ncbi:MAG: sigma-54-dependent Fis family transcriptional regulator [Chloroflexi bacterium]|nr:sigma-54-dependent Fis family transcriptional regulator [Chloroflexota bacterium]
MTKRHILIADDDASIRALLRSLLEGDGYRVSEARTGGEVINLLSDGKPVDLLLMDLRMPELSGMDILQRITDQGLGVPVILMTAFGTANIAIKAIQLGAHDYITKPFEIEDVLVTIRRFFEYQELTAEVRALRTQVGARDPTERIVGRSSCMLEIYKTIGKVARTDATVLIMGETGTGKELVAETIHFNSLRRTAPLVKVACASLPETLLESELFGHEKGSFTSAYTQRKGRFELANKGTIFLDEIGEMSLGTQKKLLRVLQEREFERVGGNVPIKVDTRVVAATNKNLLEEVEAGRFRADLYYRLNVITIHMPPLRERKDDIPFLVEHFLDKHRFAPGAPPAKITDEAIELLMRHDWPGNVRELENTIERAVVLAQGGVITGRHLLLTPVSTNRIIDVGDRVRNGVTLEATIADVERLMILEALRQHGGDRSAAAHALGLPRRQLLARMRDLNIEPALETAAAPVGTGASAPS